MTSHVTGFLSVRTELWAGVMNFATVESRFLIEGIPDLIPNAVINSSYHTDF